MKNLVSKLKMIGLGFAIAGAFGLSKQVDEEYFDKIEYLDERPNKNLFGSPKNDGRYDRSISVSERAFINEGLQTSILYRDLNADGIFDEVHFYISKNDFETIKKEIKRNPENTSEIEFYKDYIENECRGKSFYDYDKKIENKDISELDLETQSRIKKLMDMEVSKKSLEDLLEKEFREKSDWANPNSENTLYNKIKRAYETPGGLDAIKILRDEETTYPFDAKPKEYCDEYKNDGKPIQIEVRAKKNNTDLIFAVYEVEYYCEERLRRFGFTKKRYTSNYMIRFTDGPGAVGELIDFSDSKTIFYERAYFKIDKKGEMKMLKDHPDAVSNYYKNIDQYSPEDLNRIKDIVNSAESESLLKSFIKKEYAKRGF